MGDSLPSSVIGFVPRLLAERLSGAAEAGLTPRADRLEGALLFADISGFTSLTERLAERGPAGAEVLKGVVDAYFSRLIDLVAAHGGDVSTLAGDAVVAFWTKTDDRSLIAAIHDSLACAREMHDTLGPAAANNVPLRLRIGLGAGPLWTATVGGIEGRWEFLVAGAALADASDALEIARPTETIVSSAAWQLVAASYQGEFRSGGFVRLTRAPDRPDAGRHPTRAVAGVPDGLIEAFIPKAVRADRERFFSDAEFRLVTVLFLITNLDYEAESALPRSQDSFAAVQETVYRYQGSVNRIDVDDKGTVTIAAWGIRDSAHEEDAARGLKAALTIHRTLQAQGIECGIGVTTGQVFCSVLGNDIRREFAMIGDVMNVASRLAECKNGVLCDESSARAAGPRQRVEPQPPLVLKGRSQPVTVFRPLGSEMVATAVPSVFVGRVGERQRIREHLDRVGRGTAAAIVVLEGDAGIGKSFLLRHTAAEAASRGFRVARGAADVAERATPHFVWRAVLLELLEAQTLTGPELAERVCERLGPAWQVWAPLLNPVLPLDLPDSPATRQLIGQGRAARMRDMIVHLLETSAGHGLIVTLDDGHWFDAGTWDDLGAVASARAAILVLVATRPTDAPASGYATLVDARRVERIFIDRLPDLDLLCLVLEWTGARRLSADVERFFKDRALGNPFFAEELLRTLQDRGALAVSGGVCRFVPTVDRQSLDALPHRVHEVVAARIDRLARAQQALLKAASVVAGAFTQSILAAIHPAEPDWDRVAGYLEELAKRGLLVKDGEAGSPTYAFKHVITREVAYQRLSFDDRRTLNRAIARWYEEQYAGNLTPYIPLLAHHWKEAASPPLARSAQVFTAPPLAQKEDGERAIDYLEQAAEKALAVYANGAAIQSLESVIEIDELLGLASDRLRQARWQWRLGLANLQQSRNRVSQVHLERSLALLGWRTPRNPLHLSVSLIGRVLALSIFRLVPALRSRGRSAAADAVDLAADVYHELSEIAYFDNSLPRLLDATVRTLDLADRSGSPRLVARACATAAVATGTARLHRLARHYCRRSLEAAANTDDLSAGAFSQLACGVYLSGVGAWQDLDTLLADSARAFAALGDRYRYELTIAQRGYMFLHRGQFARARELLEESLDSTDTLQVRLLGTAGLVVAELAQHRLDHNRLGDLEQLLADVTQRSERILGAGVLAAARMRTGDAAGARSAAAAIRRLDTAVPPAFYALRGLAGFCETESGLLATTDATAAGGALRRATRDLRRFAFFFPIGLPSALLWIGRLQARRGRHRAAESAWKRAIGRAERLGMPYDAALAYLERSQASSVPMTTRREYLDRAATMLADLRADGDLCRVEQASRAG